jgi:hypothetical protein
MRITLLLCVLLLRAGFLSAQQSLTSVVFDHSNGIPVSNANVYLEGTSIYTTTDSAGRFVLKTRDVYHAPLIVSHVSYEKVVVPAPFEALPDTLEAALRIQLLGEIVARTERFTRTQMLKAFRRQFLGTSGSAGLCVIVNEDKINLMFDRQENLLIATCPEPVIILNNYLGYRIIIDLNRFETLYGKATLSPNFARQTSFKGSTFFEDLRPGDKTVRVRREAAYTGSSTHFLQTLATGQWEKTRYILFKTDDDFSLGSNSFEIENHPRGFRDIYLNEQLASNGVGKETPYFARLRIHHRNREDSEAIFYTNRFRLDRYGNLEDPAAILFTGYMGRQRIGDLLPSDYNPETEAEGKETGDPLEVMAERLYAYREKTPVEKLYVHQDRTLYLPGDTLWFKVYQSFSGKTENRSGVVYVDVANGNNRPVIRSKWKLEDGVACGHIALPDSLPSGRLQLQAYTRWMQNFDTEGFFIREFQVGSFFAGDTTERKTPRPELAFFPEGGNLVAGLPSRIAFLVTDANGHGMPAKGFLANAGGKTVLTFETEHDGMGSFHFIPEAGEVYTARLAGIDSFFVFPGAYPEGVVMEARCTEDNLRITCKHNLTASPTRFFLAIHQEGTSFFHAALELKEAVVVADIPAEKLPAGIFTVTLYDHSFHAWRERSLFVNYPEQLHLQAVTDKESYGNRAKVTLRIKVTDSSGIPCAGDFSLAVVRVKSDDTQTRHNFYTDFFLQSELRGRIDRPASYFADRDLRWMNLLMLTHGWRRFPWEEMAKEKGFQPYFPIEQSLTFSGSVQLRNKKQKPESVELVALIRHDSIGETISTRLGQGGAFLFTGYDFTDTAEVILSAMDKNRTFGVHLAEYPNPPSGYYAYEESPADKETDSLAVELSGRTPRASLGIDRVIHQLPDVQVTARKRTWDSRIRHNPQSVEQTIEAREGVSYGGKGAFGILDQATSTVRRIMRTSLDINWKNPEEKNYILDGRLVSENELKSLPAQLIDRVEFLSSGAGIAYSGRKIFFYTRTHEDMAYNNGPVRTAGYSFAGYNRQKEFYAPNYAVGSDYFIPDHRNTLHWQPDIRTDGDGEAEISFYTSDDKGEYVIHCEGRSCDGVIGVSFSRLTVE